MVQPNGPRSFPEDPLDPSVDETERVVERRTTARPGRAPFDQPTVRYTTPPSSPIVDPYAPAPLGPRGPFWARGAYWTSGPGIGTIIAIVGGLVLVAVLAFVFMSQANQAPTNSVPVVATSTQAQLPAPPPPTAVSAAAPAAVATAPAPAVAPAATAPLGSDTVLPPQAQAPQIPVGQAGGPQITEPQAGAPQNTAAQAGAPQTTAPQAAAPVGAGAAVATTPVPAAAPAGIAPAVPADTAPGTVLNLGDTWRQNGLALTLGAPQLSSNGFSVSFTFLNGGQNNSTFQFTRGSAFSATDNRNDRFTLANSSYRYNFVLQPNATLTLDPQHTGGAITFSGPVGNTQVNSIIVKFSNVNGITNAQWRIPIQHQ